MNNYKFKGNNFITHVAVLLFIVSVNKDTG